MPRGARLEVMDGVSLWPGALDGKEQAALIAEVFRLAKLAPFYRPAMPVSGKPFSVAFYACETMKPIQTGSGYAEYYPVESE